MYCVKAPPVKKEPNDRKAGYLTERGTLGKIQAQEDVPPRCGGSQAHETDERTQPRGRT